MNAAERVATGVASTSLAAIAALHALWATGSSWPLPDAESIADTVTGRSAERMPGPLPCLAVAAALSLAAALVGGHPRRAPRLSRLGAGGVVGVLTLRGTLGLAGRTDIISPGSSSARLRRIDRRVYSPICLSIAALALPAALRRTR